MVIYCGDCMLINGYLHPLEHFPPAVPRRLNWRSLGLHWNFDPSLPTCRYNLTKFFDPGCRSRVNRRNCLSIATTVTPYRTMLFLNLIPSEGQLPGCHCQV